MRYCKHIFFKNKYVNELDGKNLPLVSNCYFANAKKRDSI